VLPDRFCNILANVCLENTTSDPDAWTRLCGSDDGYLLLRIHVDDSKVQLFLIAGFTKSEEFLAPPPSCYLGNTYHFDES
jgi:hypothetical protein